MQLSFDTNGQLVAPVTGVGFDPLAIPGGEPLLVSVDHGTATTQYSDPFSIVSLTQDGFPAGRLDSVTVDRSEEHTSELQSLMRISYAVFCLKKKKKYKKQ